MGIGDFLRGLFGGEQAARKPAAASQAVSRKRGPRLPASVERVRLDPNEGPVSYMPYGFLPLRNNQLGNGDVFGLYWPVGREDREPLVCETEHDGGLISPHFSNLDAFLAKQEDPDEWVERPTPAEDPASPLVLYEAGREALTRHDFNTAIAKLEQSVAALPEYRDALASLIGQYVRAKRQDDACRAAARLIISSPFFGYSQQIGSMATWFAKQKDAPEDVRADPVWAVRERLISIPTGGGKDDSAYPVLRQLVDDYVARGEVEKALLALQTYVTYMNSETVSLRQRHGYSFEEKSAWQMELAEKLPHGPRHFVD